MKTTFDDCISCMECVNNCPENALYLKKNEFSLRSDLCSGLGCLRCVRNCKQNVFKYNQFYKKSDKNEL
jgi:NAD-dependent dihydropyrimidine dehydrogenase PreA subunit